MAVPLVRLTLAPPLLKTEEDGWALTSLSLSLSLSLLKIEEPEVSVLAGPCGLGLPLLFIIIIIPSKWILHFFISVPSSRETRVERGGHALV
jgi:hypothetical protein